MIPLSARRELIRKVKAQIETIPDMKTLDLQRGQFEKPRTKDALPLPACLIEVHSIRYTDMMQQLQEGQAVVSLYLYIGDYADKGGEATDAKWEGSHLKLIDQVVKAVQWLRGESFGPLSLNLEQSLSRTYQMLACRLDFKTWIYRQLERRYIS